MSPTGAIFGIDSGSQFGQKPSVRRVIAEYILPQLEQV